MYDYHISYMKKFFIYIAAFVLCTSAYAQKWELTEITSKDKSVVGYIYHTSTIGTQTGPKTEKVISGLRLVCSLKSQGTPLVVIFWDKMLGIGPQILRIKIDSKEFVESSKYQWMQDGNILVREINESQSLFLALKNARSFSINWTSNDNITRTSIFDVSAMSSQISNFATVCNASI